MGPDDLTWRIDEVNSNAWPPLRQVLAGGWAIRLSGGLTRRANSMNPLGPGTGEPGNALALAESLYRAAGQDLYLRIPSFLEPAVDRGLERLGFGAQATTLSLYRDLEALPSGTDGGVRLESLAGPGWLAARAALGGLDEARAELYGRIVSRIALPAAFAVLQEEGRAVGLAYGVLQGPLLAIDSVLTDAERRNRGHAARVLTALLQWGRSKGATAACLQVEADNAAARALYRKLGFLTEVYSYHYRKGPETAA